MTAFAISAVAAFGAAVMGVFVTPLGTTGAPVRSSGPGRANEQPLTRT